MKKPKEILEIEEIIGGTLEENHFTFDENGKLVLLDLSNRNLRDITFLIKYIHLKELHLANNQISSFEALTSLRELEFLNLSHNQIKDLSFVENQDFSDALVWLDLLGNEIKEIPYSFYISTRERLKKGLENNKIVIHEHKINLGEQYKSGLTFVRISLLLFSTYHYPSEPYTPQLELDNQVDFLIQQYIREHIGNINNSFLSILKQGHQATIAYYEALKNGSQQAKEIKILLLGDGGAGKTTLMKRLLGDAVNKDEKETQGITIEKDLIDDIQINYWDFGGQEIQHNTHQFFLTENSIYLLVLDNRREEQPAYWLEYVKSLGGNSPVIIVSNKIDNTAHSIDKFDAVYLKEKYPFIHGFHKVSAIDGNNVDYLKKALVELIKTQIFPVFGKSWIDIKAYIEKETVLGKNYLTSEAYHAYCQAIVDERSEETILTWLRNMGRISYYQRNLNTKHFYILNPEWLTYAVYKIILSEKAVQQNGTLKVSDFEEILREIPQENTLKSRKHYRYEPRDSGFLLEMMKEYNLCYTTDNQQIIIPSAIKMSYKTNFSIQENSLKFYFQYLDFLPPAIFSRFLVRLYSKRKGDAVWRTGIELFDTDTQSHALVREDKDKKRIYIYVNGERRREFFQQLRSQIVELNQLFPKMRVEERIPIPSAKLEEQSVDYEELINHELDKKDEYYHAKTREYFSVKALLSSIETGEKTQKQLAFLQAMEERIPFTLNINNSANQTVTNSNSNTVKVDLSNNTQLDELKEYLLDLDDLATQNKVWQKELIRVLGEDALRKAINEFHQLEEASDKASQKTSISILERIFKKLTSIKDIAGVGIEIGEKIPKIVEMWEKLKTSISN